MKIIYQLIFICLFPMLAHAQLNIEWQKSLGGTSSEVAHSVKPTFDGGYIVAGFALSNNGDVQGAHGGGDLWVVKLDQSGEIEWQKALGGNSTELAFAVQQTNDGGYFAAGKTYSNNGDVTVNHGELDYWVVKLDSMGELEWQKSLGGSEVEECNYAEQTSDGGYILADYSGSNDGDITMNKGYYDCWVVKLTALGDIEWEKSLGGSNGADMANCIRQTSDGGYIVAGQSNSTNGDVTGNHGDDDYWVVKLNTSGEIEWQKSLGGTSIDIARWVSQTSDSGYLIVGESGSINGQVTGAHGGFDVWAVTLSASGDLQWQKAFGGTDEDYGRMIKEIDSNRILIGALTISTDGDVQGNDGGVDVWVVILNKNGTIRIQKTFGGTDTEDFYSMEETEDKGFVFSGFTRSNDGDVSGNHGGSDCWIVKLSPAFSTIVEIQASPLEIYPNPAIYSISIKTPSEASNLSISTTDLLGREISRQTPTSIVSGTVDLDVSSFPNGMYLVNIQSHDGRVFSGRFVKQH